MSNDQLIDALRETIALTLGTTVQELPEDAGVDTVSAWTSLQHLAVVAAVEDQFGIQMDMDEMTSATNIKALAAVVAHHRGDITG